MTNSICTDDKDRIEFLTQTVLGKKTCLSIKRMGGLTNRTYEVTFADGESYAVRIPGDGTAEMIERADEKKSTKLACDLKIDAELLYFGDDGEKVTAFIPNAITMSVDTLKNDDIIARVAEVLERLHNCGVDTGVPFEVFDMATSYEKIILENRVALYADYENVKEKVMSVKSVIDNVCNPMKVPCHNDPLCENWVMSGENRMFLIDWEYAGMNDGFWDLADVSIEAEYDSKCDELLLKKYLHREPNKLDWKHFFACKLYVDYLWTLWAKTRVPYDGQAMEDWAKERYKRLKSNISAFEAL